MSKKLFSKVFILLLVVGLLFAVAPTKQALAQSPSVWDGTYPGTKPAGMLDPVGGVQEVHTAAEFAWLASQTDMFPAGLTTVKLMVDIDLDNHLWTPSGGLASGSAATGNIFDGNGHTISKLNADQKLIGADNFSALFVGANGGAPIVKDLVIDGATVEATGAHSFAAVVVAANDFGGDFINITVKNATVKATKYAGGISTYSSSYDGGANFTNCAVEGLTIEVQEMLAGTAVDKPHVGGILGYMNEGKFSGNTVKDLTITVHPVAGQPVATERVGVLIGTAQANVLVGTYDISNVTYNTAPYTKIIGLDVRAYKVVNATQMLGYTTIQAAINAAVDGDTIQVAAGTYEETVDIIDKDLTLIGQPGAIIKSPVEIPARTGTSWKAIVFVHHSNATIDGFTIDGAGRGNLNSRFLGVQFFEADGVLKNSTVTNVTWTPFNGAQEGIGFYAYNAVQPARSVSLQDNTFVNNQKGDVNIYGSPLNVIIEGNTFTGRGNTSILAQNGVSFQGGATGSVQDNSFSGYSYSKEPPDEWNWGAAGLLLYGAGDVTLGGGNNFTGNDNHLYIYDSGFVAMGAETFGPSTAPVDFGYFVINYNDSPLDLTQSTFPVTDPFDLAVRIWDGIDEAGNGLARFEAGNVYVNVDGSIQRAIDLATAGDIIHVAAGAYPEDVLIDKSLSILGPNSEISPVTGTRVPEAVVKSFRTPYSEAMTGVTIKGFEITGQVYSTASLAGIYVGNTQNVTIEHNYIHGVEAHGIAHFDTPISNLNILDNKLINVGTGTNSGVYIGFLTNAVISGNLIDTTPYGGILLTADSTGVDVVGNTISNTAGVGIQISSGLGGIDVSGNIISNAGNGLNEADKGGIRIYGSGLTDSVSVYDNTISGSQNGIGIKDSTSCDLSYLDIYHNSIATTNEVQVYNGCTDTSILDVTENWWESITGPTVGKVVGTADYTPWCGEAECTTLVYPPVHNVTQDTWHGTIQAAIDAAVDGNLIEVAPGTYEGFSVVGKTGISITGAGDAQTIIAPTALITTGVGHKYTPNMLASVFVNGSTGITIEGMAIKSTAATPGSGGANAIVFWNNSTGSIEESIVQGLYTINGAQTGQGIAVDGATSVLSLVNTDISGFNKNAIDVVDGNGGTTVPGNLTVNVSGGTITGAGPITATAQNGVSFWNRAGGVLGGSITGATISGFDYTPDTTSATGILAYGLGGGTLTVSGNTFSASEVFMTDNTGTLNLYSILMGNTFPDFTGVFGDSIMVSPTKMLMDPATFATTDTCVTTTPTYTVTVKVQDVEDLVAYYLNMTYDKDLITVTYVQNLTLAGTATPGNTWANGEIHFGWRPVSGAGDPVTHDGDVDLIKISFRATGLAGTGAFTILPSSQLEEWPNAFGIPFEITGGASVSFGSIVTNTSAEPDKAYCNLAVAVAEAAGSDTLRVDANFTQNVNIYINKALTLDTNGKTISRTNALDSSYVFLVQPGGDLTINGGGTITTSAGTAVRIVGDATTLAKVTLNDATLYGPLFSVAVVGNTTATYQTTAYQSLFVMTGGHTNETVMVQGNGAEAEITGGTLTGAAPIMGNGNASSGGTKITFGGTAAITSATVAIYHPQEGLLTINGGTITGTNGIEMDAGDLEITGGTIQGTGTCATTPVSVPNHSTDTGDAILIFNRDGYGAGQLMDVTISGSPIITSTSCYALREYTAPTGTSRLGVAAISGGHFTGGAPGAVSFTTVSDANLDLTGGDYSTDPIAFVYAPYGTYLNTDTRWYIAPLPVISSTTFDDQVTLGVATTFSLTVDPSVPGAFSMVFTGYPSETEITYLGTTYYCEGSPCVITVPVMLTGVASETLVFGITVATGGSETPATSYSVAATLHAPAPAYGTTGRDLDTLTATVPVTPGFTVSGTFTMQGRTTRADIPVTLTWVNTLGVVYGPHMNTDEQAVNFRLTVNYGGTYTITTLQPRFLNITADLLKQVTLTGDYTFANPLWLRAGNAIWQTAAGVYDNTIDVTDAQKVLTTWNTTGGTDALNNSGDVNFDGNVTIKDLTLVGGNMDLTSALAYGETLWIP